MTGSGKGKWLTAALLAIITISAQAQSGLLGGSLGRWLDTEALPELGRMLGQHPRFKGETIRVTSLENGKPLRTPSRLHQAVEAHLTQRLLGHSGVRILWGNHSRCGPPVEAVYLLGIEIEQDGSRSHKLNIGLIDVADSIWVSGVNFTWRGGLSAIEVSALGRPTREAPRGTVDSPLPITASEQIAAAMHQHLSCALPDGLDGPMFLAPAAGGAPAAARPGQCPSAVRRGR